MGQLNQITILLMMFLMLIGCQEDGGGSFSSEVIKEKGSDVELSVPLSPQAYLAWVENKENGLISEKEIGDYRFSTLFKSIEYIAVNELKTDTITEKALNEKKASLEGLQYFTLRVGLKENQGDVLKHKITDPKEYYAKIEYFSFAMQKDIKLIDGKDTLACVLHHFERTYGASPNCNFTLAFEDKEAKEISNDKTLIFDDPILGIGRIKLKIKAENINKIPELKTT